MSGYSIVKVSNRKATQVMMVVLLVFHTSKDVIIFRNGPLLMELFAYFSVYFMANTSRQKQYFHSKYIYSYSWVNLSFVTHMFLLVCTRGFCWTVK